MLIGAEWFPDTAGGLNRTFRELFLGLADAGVEPTGVVVGPVNEPVPGLAVLPPGPLPRRAWHLLRAMLRLRKRSDVVDAHFALYGIAGAFVSRLSGRPLMVHFHGPWADESAAEGQRSWRLGAKRALERAVYRSAASHVVHTFAFRRLLVERYGVSPWSVELVPPAVDLKRFTPAGRSEARERLGIPADRKVGVSVRRLTPRMGLDDLLRAWALLPRDDADLLIAGEGPDRPRLESIANELGLDARVRFLGSVPDDLLPDVYRAGDVCAVPSTRLEGFGLVAIEALACGTPVVVADTGGLPEAVAGLPGDIVVPVGDHGALARRLEAAFAGSSPLPAAERCREHAELFSPARLIQSHRELYAKLLTPPSRRRRVVYVDRCDPPAMTAAALLRTLAGLDGVDSHVVLGVDGPLASAVQRSGTPVEVLPGAAAGRLYPLRLARRLRVLKPDVVHSISLDGRRDRLAAKLARVSCASSS